MDEEKDSLWWQILEYWEEERPNLLAELLETGKLESVLDGLVDQAQEYAAQMHPLGMSAASAYAEILPGLVEKPDVTLIGGRKLNQKHLDKFKATFEPDLE